jgi:hypothetical protein
MSTRLTIPLAAVIAALASPATTQEQAPEWWQRPLLAGTQPVDAERVFVAALHQEKAVGQLDSAVAGYLRVIELHAQRRADRSLADRAGARLRHLRAVGGREDLANFDRRPLGNSLTTSSGVARVARRLQLDPTVALEVGDEMAAPLQGTGADPLLERRRWLQRMLRVRTMGDPTTVDDNWLAAFGRGIEAVRSSLGLRGVAHYVEDQLRRRRARQPTPHERLLLALQMEKEQRDFGGALRRYRELVQLDPDGGIATRLQERAREGAARCRDWQGATPPGS